MAKKWWAILLITLSLLLLSGCAQVELAVKVAGDATIPSARLAVIVNDATVFSQLQKVAVDEYKKLPEEERNFVKIMTKEDAPPYIVAWEWNFPDEEKAREFTQQFLGSTANLSKDGDLVVLEASLEGLEGKELDNLLNQWGASAVKPFLNSITLFIKAYMPGEILSYVEGEVVENKVWQQELNLGEVYKNKPTVNIEVISRDK